MKCEKMEKRILLEDSGELPVSGREELERHTVACATCAGRRLELAALRRAAMDGSLPDTPAPIRAAILEAARNHRPVPHSVLPWVVRLPFMRYAAIALLGIGLGFATFTWGSGRFAARGNGHSSENEAILAEINAMSEELIQLVQVLEDSSSDADSPSALFDVDALAEEILQAEGG
jgi:anti-sigma factor RsiW